MKSITPSMVERWVMGLREKAGRNGSTLSHSTINHCLKCLKLILREEKRRGYLYENPPEDIEQLEEHPVEKSILSIDEVRELFREDRFDVV
ncbi:MAG: hypothetical protein GTO54_01860, partial [Nitrososphaeria archaeon]|nr:hypothetical protein [Nitrososphaeria archaeon]